MRMKLKKANTIQLIWPEINDCISVVFHELYGDEYKSRNDLREMAYYDSVNMHPFLGKFLEDEHDIHKNVINEHEIKDRVLMDYLNKMSSIYQIRYWEYKTNWTRF